MKLAIVVVCLTAIAGGLVYLRRERTHLRHEVQRLEAQRVSLRRDLWDQQVRLGWQLAPAEVRRRAEEMALPLVDKSKAGEGLAGRTASPGPALERRPR